MTPDGEIRQPRPTPLADRIFRIAMLVAGLGFLAIMAAALLWFAIFAIPIAVGAALVAYLAWRWKAWRGVRERRF